MIKKLFVFLCMFVFINLILTSIIRADQNNLSLTIINKWLEYGEKICKNFDEGEFYLRFYPLQIIDVTNDNIEDYILHETSGLCENSASMFAGGTGGEHWRIYVNPKINNFNFDEYIHLMVQNWNLTKYENKTALYILQHGVVCDRVGYIGCYSTILITPDGVKLIDGPIPGDEVSNTVN